MDTAAKLKVKFLTDASNLGFATEDALRHINVVSGKTIKMMNKLLKDSKKNNNIMLNAAAITYGLQSLNSLRKLINGVYNELSEKEKEFKNKIKSIAIEAQVLDKEEQDEVIDFETLQ